MNFKYVALRMVRHFMPQKLVRALLLRQWIIRPGIETREPETAIQRYLQALEAAGRPVGGQRVLVFGYGGNFSVACGLLAAGADHVVLCDRFAPPYEEGNRRLLHEYAAFLALEGGRVRPRSEKITLLHADIVQVAAQGEVAPFDIVLSNSVYEHLDGPDEITAALACLTAPNGLHLHYIDLRDHYFKYPFEMLTYSTPVWRGWLNPGSNLNRCRVPDYRKVFARWFQDVTIDVTERDLAAFEGARSRIRPEFLSGDPQMDAITQIRVTARGPKTTP